MSLIIEHDDILFIEKTDKGSESIIKLGWDLSTGNNFLIDMPLNDLTLHIDHRNQVKRSFQYNLNASFSPAGLTAKNVMFGVFYLPESAIEAQQGIWFMGLVWSWVIGERSDAELDLI